MRRARQRRERFAASFAIVSPFAGGVICGALATAFVFCVALYYAPPQPTALVCRNAAGEIVLPGSPAPFHECLREPAPR
jgi:hypothetical protein